MVLFVKLSLIMFGAADIALKIQPNTSHKRRN